MFKKLVTSAGTATVIGLLSLSLTGGVFAAPTSSINDQGNLAPGHSDWYAFQYAGDGSPIEIWDTAGPQGDATFNIWTPEEMQQLQAQGGVDPVGRGTTDPTAPGDLSWDGNFSEQGTYFVQVQDATTDPVAYTLHIAGSGVAATSDQNQTNQSSQSTTSQPAPAAQPQAVQQGGATPDQALGLREGQKTANPGQTIWFAFDYAGDLSPVQVWVDGQSQGGMAFNVWTPDQLQQQGVDPVGRGTVDTFGPGDLSWLGSFSEQGTYFVEATNTGTNPTTFDLHLKGDGASVPPTMP